MEQMAEKEARRGAGKGRLQVVSSMQGSRGCEEDGEASGGCSAGRQGSGGRADVVAGWEKPVKGARGQSCCVTLWWVTGRRVDRDRVGAMPIPPLQAGEDEPGPWGHGGQRRR